MVGEVELVAAVGPAATLAGFGFRARGHRVCTSVMSADDLGGPVRQVVVVGHARDLVVADLEERAGGQNILLSMRRWQAFVGDEIFTMHDEFGATARTIVA